MKSIHEQADTITAVPLLKREEFGEYVVYTCLSSNGVDIYRTTLKDGKFVGCTCPATVVCKHGKAAMFEEEWTKPVTTGELVAKEQEMLAVAEQVAPLVVGDMAADLHEHVVDDLTAQPTIERKTFKRENTRLGATEGFSLLA